MVEYVFLPFPLWGGMEEELIVSMAVYSFVLTSVESTDFGWWLVLILALGNQNYILMQCLMKFGQHK